MKKICTTLFLVLCTSLFPLFAQDGSSEETTKKTADKDAATLENEIEELKKTINELQKDTENTALDVEDLEIRVDDAEKSFGRNKLDFKMDFRFTINNFIYKDNSMKNKEQGYITADGKMLNSMNLRGRLNFLGHLGKKFKLTGWLTMYKKVLQSTPDGYDNLEILPNYDLARAHYPADSRVYMERLYIDWFVLDWLAFSIGRIGLVDGIPADTRYDTVSLGSVPETALNVTADAIYMTLKLEPLLGLKNGFFRLSWTPSAYQHYNTGFNLFEKNKFFDNSNNYAANLDFAIPGINRSRFVYVFYYTDSFNALAEFPENDFGMSGTMRSYGSLNGLIMQNITLKLDRFLNTPIDLCFSANLITVLLTKRDGKNQGFIGEDNSDEEYVRPLLSMLGNDLTGGILNGYMLYGGFRYHTPIEFYNTAVQIGGEFIYGSKNNGAFTVPDTTELFRYAIRGYNAEGYVTIPLYTSANIRLGYIFQHHDYAPGFAFTAGGGIPAVDEDIHNIHMMFNVYFQ